MTDFLSAFQRRESDSEGSEIDDDQPEFAHEEIHHHSDDEAEVKPEAQQQEKLTTSNKESESHKQHHDQHHGSQGNRHKNDRYLYQGEEAHYQSDEEEEEDKGKRGKYYKPTQKKGITYVPKGNYYQHDTRGNEGEYSGKDGNKQVNHKWRHDKYEKTYETKKDNKNYGNRYEGKRYEKYEKTYEPKHDKQEKYERVYEKKHNKYQEKQYDKPHDNKFEKGKRYDNVDVIYVPKNKPQDTSAQDQTKNKSGTGHHPHKQLSTSSAQYEGPQFSQTKYEKKEYFKKPVESYVEYIPKDFNKSQENEKEKKKAGLQVNAVSFNPGY